jgi:hypothetical protein
MSRSARRCKACGEPKISVRATRIHAVGGDADLIADLWRAVSPIQVEMER